jgi:transketolase
MDLEPLGEKLQSFGWHFIDIDGHDLNEIKSALDEFDTITGKPTFIKANTVKGKGVSFMENNKGWHGKAPKPDELKEALEELETLLDEE